MAKKITKKQKQQFKLKILALVVTCIVALGSFLFYKITTPPTLESIISKTTFDTSEVTIEVKVSNKNEELNYTFVVSDENNYIKSVKEVNDVIETSIVYKQDDKYFLYVNKDIEETIELKNNDGENFINNLKKDVYDLESYLDINYDTVKYYFYSEELITFSNYTNGVFYDNELEIIDNKLVSMKKVFGVNNIVNTVDINIDYNVDVQIPN